MQYIIGDKITSKKNHACGGNEWEIVRIGADVKLKCAKCGRAVFMSVDEVKKITKSLISKKEETNV